MAVAVTVAFPFESVVAGFVVNVTLGRVCAGAAKVTVTPGTGLPPESFTVATRLGKAAPVGEPAAALWLLPLVIVIEAAPPKPFVRVNVAPVADPEAAVTVYVPVVAPAVNTADVATPDTLVIGVFTPPTNVPGALPFGTMV